MTLLLSLLGLLIVVIAFIVWDNARMTKRAEEEARAPRTERFPTDSIFRNAHGIKSYYRDPWDPDPWSW
jgi:hypothetical protein